MSVPRVDHDAVLLQNGEVLVARSYNAGPGYLASAELYNSATGTWTATGSMTTSNLTNWALLLHNGEVFVLNDNLYTPQRAPGPPPLGIPSLRTHPLRCSRVGDVFAAGTKKGDSIYHTWTDQWTNFAPPPCTTRLYVIKTIRPTASRIRRTNP